MSLTPEDLSSINGLLMVALDEHTETKIRPMVHEIVNEAVGTKVPALINRAIDNLAIIIGEGFNEATERFDKVDSEISAIKIDVAELKTDVAELKVDVAELKSDVSELKTDVAELKTDVSELKVDMREVKWGLAETVRRPEFIDVRDRMTRLEHKPSSN